MVKRKVIPNLAFSIAILYTVFLVISTITPASGQQQFEQQFSSYEDPEGRFTIDYPSNWFVSNEISDEKVFEDIAVTFGDAPEPEVNQFTDIDVTTLPRVSVRVSDELLSSSSLEEYTAILIDRISDYSIGEIKSTQSKLAGLPAYQIEYVSKLGGDAHSEIWTIKDNQVFNIEYIASSQDYNTDLPIFQKMIDSFAIIQ
jgi:PsbP-like protein